MEEQPRDSASSPSPGLRSSTSPAETDNVGNVVVGTIGIGVGLRIPSTEVAAILLDLDGRSNVLRGVEPLVEKSELVNVVGIVGKSPRRAELGGRLEGAYKARDDIAAPKDARIIGIIAGASITKRYWHLGGCVGPCCAPPAFPPVFLLLAALVALEASALRVSGALGAVPNELGVPGACRAVPDVLGVPSALGTEPDALGVPGACRAVPDVLGLPSALGTEPGALGAGGAFGAVPDAQAPSEPCQAPSECQAPAELCQPPSGCPARSEPCHAPSETSAAPSSRE